MALFSQRKGLKPSQKLLQMDGIDDDLRNNLWNCLHICYWRHWEPEQYGYQSDIAKGLDFLVRRLWLHYFKKPLDEVPNYFPKALTSFREYFFRASWNEVFDFIEFIYLNGPEQNKEAFTKFCNGVLEEENSGYRFVEGKFVEITSQEELDTIANSASTLFAGVNSHISRAVELLSDRKKPDYRNSIKESISAVESLCQVITGDKNATLGKALAILESKHALHPALKQSFSSLYGYTSNADGIRHAMLEEPNLTFTDAKYMLVSCGAFINFLIGKASDLGLSMTKNP